MFDEERGNVSEMMENAKPVSKFELQFLSENEKRTISKVYVKNINLQDLLYHLRRGESVLITPKHQEDFSAVAKKLDRKSWFFTHM